MVRGGYGIFFQPLTYPGWNSGVSGGRDGFNTNVILSPTMAVLRPQRCSVKDSRTHSIRRHPITAWRFDNGKYPGVYREFNQGHLPNSQQWNLTVEHQFTKEFYVDVAYVGNKGTHLISGVDFAERVEPKPAFDGQRALRHLRTRTDFAGWGVGSVCRLGYPVNQWPVLANGGAGASAVSAVLRHHDRGQRECRLLDI